MPTSSALLIKELGVNQIIYKINYRIMIEIEKKPKMVKNYILFLSQSYWRSYIRINKKTIKSSRKVIKTRRTNSKTKKRSRKR